MTEAFFSGVFVTLIIIAIRWYVLNLREKHNEPVPGKYHLVETHETEIFAGWYLTKEQAELVASHSKSKTWIRSKIVPTNYKLVKGALYHEKD